MTVIYLQRLTEGVVDVYQRGEAAVYWDSGPDEGPQSVGVRDADPENLETREGRMSLVSDYWTMQTGSTLVRTWYVNTPCCDVLINKVFSTFPTTRARNTTSKDVFPPGGIICRERTQ